jgi:hypothetical protein
MIWVYKSSDVYRKHATTLVCGIKKNSWSAQIGVSRRKSSQVLASPRKSAQVGGSRRKLAQVGVSRRKSAQFGHF